MPPATGLLCDLTECVRLASRPQFPHHVPLKTTVWVGEGLADGEALCICEVIAVFPSRAGQQRISRQRRRGESLWPCVGLWAAPSRGALRRAGPGVCLCFLSNMVTAGLCRHRAIEMWLVRLKDWIFFYFRFIVVT